MSPSELKTLVTGECIGANQRPLSSDFSNVDLPSDKDYSNEKFRGSEEIVLERELCFGKVSSASNGALKIQDFGLSLKRVTLKASGGGKESEVVLVDKISDGDGDQVLVGGGEVLLAVNRSGERRGGRTGCGGWWGLR